MVFDLIILLGYISLSLSISSRNVPCPVTCICSPLTHTAECQGGNFSRVPYFPNYVRNLTFTGMNMSTVGKKTFSNIEHLNITVLILRHNNFSYISSVALSRLKHLVLLDLSGNGKLNISQLATSLSNMNAPNLTEFKLNSMALPDEPIELYQSLAKTNLTRLSMSRNNFKTLNFSALGQYLPTLRYIDASFGNLNDLTPGRMPNLEELQLHHNYIEIGESFFSLNGACIFPNISVMDLKSNFINYFEGRFWCLDKLQELRLDKNPVKKILRRTFQNLTSIRILHLNQLGDRLFKIEKYAFQSNTLKALLFAKNKFQFTKNAFNSYFSPDKVFGGLPNLEDLDLSENVFNLSDGYLQRMLRSLKNLKNITMMACYFRTIPPNIFSRLRKLENLTLTSNHISSWDGTKVFGNTSSLRVLNLDHNYINVFNETSFPKSMMENLVSINLARNPFFCSCENLWFRKWIASNLNVLVDYPESYFCVTPPELNGTPLDKFYPSDSECDKKVKDTVIYIFTSLSLVGIFGVIIVSLLYKGRWHIRYWIYLHRSNRKGYTKLNNCDFQYAAFIVYSDEDRKWVFSKFLQIVEKEHGHKLCIHHRDFLAGKLIVDNIADCIAHSRKIVLLMTNSLIRSDWCIFETKLAQRRFLNDNSSSLVLIMLEEIDKKDMPHSLQNLVNMTTYIEWPKDKNKEDLFWSKVLKALKEEECD